MISFILSTEAASISLRATWTWSKFYKKIITEFDAGVVAQNRVSSFYSSSFNEWELSGFNSFHL